MLPLIDLLSLVFSGGGVFLHHLIDGGGDDSRLSGHLQLQSLLGHGASVP